MKTKIVTLLAGMLLLSGNVFATIYTFDRDNQKWLSNRVAYNGGKFEQLTERAGAEWTSEYNVNTVRGGGSIFQTASANWENRAYWLGVNDITLDAALGDLTNKSMSTYVRSTGNWVPRVETNTVYARWTIAAPDSTDPGKWNMWVSKAGCSIDLNDVGFGNGSNDDWVYQSIEMKESNFFQWPNFSNDGKFADVLKTYTSFGLTILPTALGDDDLDNFNSKGYGTHGELLHYGAKANDASAATWGVDNFQAVPEPATLLLLGSGIIGFSLHRRRTEQY